MAGVLLGGEPKPHEIVLPQSCADLATPRTVVGKCLAPGCKATFYRGQEAAWQDHTVKCRKRTLDQIRALAPSASKKGTIFDPEKRDMEVERHLLRVGNRMREEGRLEVLPHERAGFS